MADSIVKCVEFYDANDALDFRVVHYDLIYGDHTKRISVTVKASDMNDPADLDECRTLANVKAAIEKNAWLSSIAAAAADEEIPDLNGSVSL